MCAELCQRFCLVCLMLGSFILWILIMTTSLADTIERAIGQSSSDTIGYNLLSDNVTVDLAGECTLELAISGKLEQDHPCVVKLIRSRFVHQPSSTNVKPFPLQSGSDGEPSTHQAAAVQRLLRNKTDGYFVEFTASGSPSNTLPLERHFRWKGMVIDPLADIGNMQPSNRRRALTLSACVSLQPHLSKAYWNSSANVPCFPLYSVWLAAGKPSIDFLSLEAQGHEISLLQTVPWNRLRVQVLAVKIPHGEWTLTSLMEANGYVSFGRINQGEEMIFVQDVLRDLRHSGPGAVFSISN